MKNRNSKYSLRERIKKSKRKKLYYTVSVTMAAIVVFCTVYALILPAITMEKEQNVLDCSLCVHQHTDSCYDADGSLTCGEADYVIHTHNSNCFDENGKKLCLLPKIVTHKHSRSCYNNKNKLICKLPEAEVHYHNDLCYDKDGTLICGKLHTIQHVHGNACFNSSGTSRMSRMSVNTNDEAENGISPQSDAANNARASVNWGYNENGSIWWGDLTVTQYGADEIQENTAYIISGVNNNNLMADVTTTIDGRTYLAAILRNRMNGYIPYQQWYFEKTGGDGKYYVYFLSTNEDGSPKPLYLQFTGEYTLGWQNNRVYQTALTDDKTQATVLTMTPTNNNSYPDHIILSTEIDGYTIRVNSNADDPSADYSYTTDPASGEIIATNTYWLGYSGDSTGNYLRVSRYSPDGENTANRVETDTSVNSVINLFDYWLTDNPTDPDGDDPTIDNGLLDSKINHNHDFKFTTGLSSGSYKLNYWTQAGRLPRQGIVSPTLKDGFPVLSGNVDVNGTDSTESLAYLFDPTVQHEGKASYRNVSGLLTLNKDGYYSYDCKKNMAEYNKDDKNIYVYDKPGVIKNNGSVGQFFPFNNAPQVITADCQEAVMNHYFGMTIRSRFVQRYDGFTDETKKTTTTFQFSGDDDVWIFIDDVLVGDVGGIHDTASIDIDFSNGDVTVSVPGGWEAPVTTTIRDCYRNAGKEDSVKWNGNTFANNTTHSLKFFYLERGNNESNLELKFNLTEVPKTAIDKTDEYGNPVEGAKFAVYAAKGETETDTIYNMLDKKDGKIVDLSDEAGYDEHGNIIDSSGKVIANALYVGTTDSEGKMVFVDADGMRYSIDDLEGLFGKKFILREIEFPEGYRMVSVDNDLRIYQGESQKVLISDNAEVSGCRAATDLHTISTNTIYLRDKQEESKIILPPTQYYNTETDTANGTMFAVVVKYTGETEGDKVIPENITDKLLTSTEYWTPIYGSDEDGYELVDKTNGKDFYAAAIEAAQTKVGINETELREDTKHKYTEEDIEYLKYEGVTLQHQQNGTMQLFMDDLPGHIRYYYNMLPTDKKNLTRYNVIYLWTNSTLEEAKPESTFVVNTRPATIENGGDDIIYSGVERMFSAQINVPNLLNDLYVQKVDKKHNLIDGATFAMYRVEQQDNDEIRYLVKDANGKESYIPLTEDAKPDGDTGEIQVGDKTIRPCNIDTTHTFEDKIHKGSIRFVNIPQGQYIIKEIKAPPGYNLNTSDIMVLVTDYRIYANAGTVEDGVIVGHGPGYLVSPLTSFASEGDINNTLTWIYAQMRISNPSTRFADLLDPNIFKEPKLDKNGNVVRDDKGNVVMQDRYVTKNNSSENTTPDRTHAFTTDLIYAKDKAGTTFNYVPDPKRNPTTDVVGYRRIFTDSGWSEYQIYQDYDYGSVEAAKNKADYYNWSKGPITTLFSRSTYIRVTDENDVTVKIKKVDSTNNTMTLSDAQFRLYRMNSLNEKEYYVKEKVEIPQETTGSETPTGSVEKKYVETVSWSTDSSKAFVVTTGDNGMSIAPTSPDSEDPNKATSPEFTELHDGTYYLEEIKAPSGYNQSPKPVEFTIKLAKLTFSSSSLLGGSTSDEAFDDNSNLYTYTVTVPNSTGFELPATGGRGTFVYTLGGILLIAVSLVIGYRRKRISERRLQ